MLAVLARPLPLAVIGDLLGIADADRQHFRVWADASLGMVTPDLINPGNQAPGAEAAWGELSAFIGKLIAAKRADPGDDLLSALITVRDTDDGRIDDEELLTTMIALLGAGYLTAANALAIGLVHLLPTGQLPTLTDESAAAGAVEEMLRMQTGRAAEALPRWATVDVEVAGERIGAGDLVLVKLEAANTILRCSRIRNGSIPTRNPNRHASFGHGAHHCLGAQLARMELAEAVRALAAQLPGLRLGRAPENIAWAGNPLDDGPVAVPVTW